MVRHVVQKPFYELHLSSIKEQKSSLVDTNEPVTQFKDLCRVGECSFGVIRAWEGGFHAKGAGTFVISLRGVNYIGIT